jgi:hypothetical protein
VADVEGWEARMAARAQARAAARPAEPERHRGSGTSYFGFGEWTDRLNAAADGGWERAERVGWEWRAATMTLDEATHIVKWSDRACACIGPPLCCSYAYRTAKALVATAQYAVALVDALHRREAQRG